MLSPWFQVARVWLRSALSLQGGDALPEALAADVRRLAEAQGCFQRLLVGVAAALLLRQHAAATRVPLPAGVQGHATCCWMRTTFMLVRFVGRTSHQQGRVWNWSDAAGVLCDLLLLWLFSRSFAV
jgi:hypothetical protein